MRTWLKKFRNWQARRTLEDIARYSPEVLTNFVNERASEISMHTTMAYLEKEGFLHCDFCPTRFGLKKVGKFRVCERHAGHAEQIRDAANAAQGAK